MVSIQSEEEKNNFFNQTITGDGAYFTVKYPDGDTEFIWVKKFDNWNEDGSAWYLEAPNHLRFYEVTADDLKPYYDEEDDETYIPFEHFYIKDNKAYEIDSAQTSPFLPETFEIEFVTDQENEAIEYMIALEQTCGPKRE